MTNSTSTSVSQERNFEDQAIEAVDLLAARLPLKKRIGVYREHLRLAYQVLDELDRASRQQRASLRKMFRPICSCKVALMVCVVNGGERSVPLVGILSAEFPGRGPDKPIPPAS